MTASKQIFDCAYQLYSCLQATTEAVMKLYAFKLIFDDNGVTMPSQHRNGQAGA